LLVIVKTEAHRRCWASLEKTVQTILPRKRCAYPVLMSIALTALAGAARAEDLPSYMALIGGRTTSDIPRAKASPWGSASTPLSSARPDGAAVMPRVLKTDPSVWLTNTASILTAADGM
jgi:hypothetical protein